MKTREFIEAKTGEIIKAKLILKQSGIGAYVVPFWEINIKGINELLTDTELNTLIDAHILDEVIEAEVSQ